MVVVWIEVVVMESESESLSRVEVDWLEEVAEAPEEEALLPAEAELEERSVALETALEAAELPDEMAEEATDETALLI